MGRRKRHPLTVIHIHYARRHQSFSGGCSPDFSYYRCTWAASLLLHDAAGVRTPRHIGTIHRGRWRSLGRFSLYVGYNSLLHTQARARRCLRPFILGSSPIYSLARHWRGKAIPSFESEIPSTLWGRQEQSNLDRTFLSTSA